MQRYRRNRVPGGTYFFTLTLQDRNSDLLIDNIDRLRNSVRRVRKDAPFHIDSWVVLPDHMHCIWTLPEGDIAYPERWRAIKKAFCKTIPKEEPRSAVNIRRGERGIWQRRYWEHTIRDDADYANHMDYVHFNPVKHGLSSYPSQWPFSSFQHCVARGVYPSDWGGAVEGFAFGEMGERV